MATTIQATTYPPIDEAVTQSLQILTTHPLASAESDLSDSMTDVLWLRAKIGEIRKNEWIDFLIPNINGTMKLVLLGFCLVAIHAARQEEENAKLVREIVDLKTEISLTI